MQKELKLMAWPIKVPSSYFTGFLMIDHPPALGGCEFGWGKRNEEKNEDYIKELCSFFEEKSSKDKIEPDSAIWGSIAITHNEFVKMLQEKDIDALHDYLSEMFIHKVAHGTAQGDFFYKRLKENQDDLQTNTGFQIYDKFLTLLEMTSIIPKFSPEQYQSNNDFLKYYSVDPDRYLDLLEENYECDLSAPKYQGGHFGIQTGKHGLYSDRDIMSLGVAIRIAENYWNKKNITICDIGCGVGHLAFYLKKFGFDNITVVDIPTTLVTTKYFLDTNMKDHGIRFLTPSEFDGNYDLNVNVDGITGYAREEADTYIKKIKENGKHFLSINKESDDFRVFDICDMERVNRCIFPYRRGYMEEDYITRK